FAFMVFAIAASGCTLGDVVRVRVPEGMRQALNASASVTYNQSAILAAQWDAWVTATAEQFASSRDTAGFFVDVGAMLINVGAQESQGALAAIPGGAAIGTLVAYIAGVVTRKPGDRKALDGLKEQLREAIGNLALERERAEAEKAKAVKEASDRAWDEATLEAKKSGGAA